MDKKRQFRIAVFIFWVVVAIAMPLVTMQSYEVIAKINSKYPDLGLFGWMVIAIWVSGLFLAMEVVSRLCEKKKWSKTCNTEGMAAAMLYIFMSSIIFLRVSG